MGKKRIIKKTEKELLEETEKIEKAVKKEVSVKKGVALKEANLYVSSTYNNTIVTLTDLNGKVLGWKSAGSVGFKGTKKGTPFAASKVGEVIGEFAKKLGIEKLHIFVKGIGAGRDSILRTLVVSGFDILSIEDITPIPHNGCRPRKPRRV
jgi:small subunit ribosomal protein S11